MKAIDLIGKRFGKLVVKAKSNQRGNVGQIKWVCECDCGNIHIVTGESIRSGKSKSCGCLKRIAYNKLENRGVAIFKHLYKSTIEKRSKKRGWNSFILFSEFMFLSTQPCYYCGLSPSNFATDRMGGKGYKKVSDVSIVYSGIDRIDSSIGYVSGNVVPCCKHCNVAKNTMTQSQFREWIKNVFNHYCK